MSKLSQAEVYSAIEFGNYVMDDLWSMRWFLLVELLGLQLVPTLLPQVADRLAGVTGPYIGAYTRRGAEGMSVSLLEGLAELRLQFRVT